MYIHQPEETSKIVIVENYNNCDILTLRFREGKTLIESRLFESWEILWDYVKETVKIANLTVEDIYFIDEDTLFNSLFKKKK
ncbi:hypothetical protein V7161_27005 [Neobacillus drentensis]|uniref:hypothetical protein n=1 Tax=Neobacillus drentensis TaxID=220684 RepID=UPI00300145FF